MSDVNSSKDALLIVLCAAGCLFGGSLAIALSIRLFVWAFSR